MVDESKREGLSALVQRASSFEIGALVKTLFGLGFDWNSVEFEGADELVPSRGPRIRRLRFEESPSERAIITLDAGLLSAGSPLPEYFRSFARSLASPDAFVRFLGFFDAVHLKDLAYCAEPSLAASSSSRIARAHRARINASSPAMLHATFRGMFPELPVAIESKVFTRDCGAGRARLGSSLDGRVILGSNFEERFAGFRVALHAESEAADCVSHWESEAHRRIALVRSSILKLDRAIEIVLLFDRYRHGQRLVSRSGERQLGVRPWLTKVKGELYDAGAVVLWRSWDRPMLLPPETPV